MVVLMVKKRLVGGEPCPKCVQAEAMLRRRGLWEGIDRVIWADEGDPSSEGMGLAQRFDVALAPFFLVQDEGAEPRVYTRILKLIKEVLTPTPGSAPGTAPVPVLGPGPGPGPGQGGGSAPAQADPAGPSLEEWAEALEGATPQVVVRQALLRYGEGCAIAFSGAEDVALIHMAAQTGLPFSVFCLDTGRLHPETYAFIDHIRRHFGVAIDVVVPLSEELRRFVSRKGLFSFLDDGHAECCGIRKVEPLGRALAGKRAWMTGQRHDQSPTRSDVPVLQADLGHRFEGQALAKFNPLAHWRSAAVWAYLRSHDVPFNPLHARGFRSIGCEPCTRPVHPGQHEREGRWWWEEATKRECGLHLEGIPRELPS